MSAEQGTGRKISKIAATLWFSLFLVVTAALAVSLSSMSHMSSFVHQHMTFIPFPFNNSSTANNLSSQFNGPRVAVCLTGNARTFYYPLVQDKILENVIAPLRESYPTDVFFNIKFDDNPRPSRPRAKTDLNATLEAIEKFSPVVLRSLNKSHDFVSGRADRSQRYIRRPSNCHSNSFASLPHSLFRSQQCLPLIEEYEKKNGFRYTWIYRMRPDVVFLDPIIRPDDIENGTLYANRGPDMYVWNFIRWWKATYNRTARIPPFTDHLLAGMRDDMTIGLNSFEAINNCTYYSVYGERNSEAALGFWTYRHGLRIHVEPWLWTLVRAVRGAECFRIRLMQIRDQKLRLAMEERCRAYNELLKEKYSEFK